MKSQIEAIANSSQPCSGCSDWYWKTGLILNINSLCTLQIIWQIAWQPQQTQLKIKLLLQFFPTSITKPTDTENT